MQAVPAAMINELHHVAHEPRLARFSAHSVPLRYNAALRAKFLD
jgi:hypothetical protein